jgi:sec-independent protein translocase protein TatB
MFDIGFSELFVIALVALIVLGPERLPKAARFAGLWVRRARAQWYSVKSELENELADEELRRSLRQARSDLEDARDSLAQGGASLKRDLEQARDEVEASVRPAAPSAVPVDNPVDGQIDTTPGHLPHERPSAERTPDA